ncbi:MAG: hypothetical protein JEY97_01550 [Bacteroidales bacterium]|nr:hypothetical protein [Bacteroidales bacterium]
MGKVREIKEIGEIKEIKEIREIVEIWKLPKFIIYFYTSSESTGEPINDQLMTT